MMTMSSTESLNTVGARLSRPGGNSSEVFPTWQTVQRTGPSQAPATVLHECEFCSQIVAKVSFEQGPQWAGTYTRIDEIVYNLGIYSDQALKAADLGCQLCQYLLSGYDLDPSSPILLRQTLYDADDLDAAELDADDVATDNLASPDTMGSDSGPRVARPWLLKAHEKFLDWCESENILWLLLSAPEDSIVSKFVKASNRFTPFWDDCVIENTWNLMNTCFKNHTSCRQNRSSRSPSRLLEIFDGPENTTCVRLVDTENPCDPFFALSYCWGQDQPLKTRKSNIGTLKGGVELETLPCTIRDAITVTRSMGITYIWIDAFCIVQDDDDDKIRELALMPDIYSNALVTIVAADPETCGMGFLDALPLAPMFRLAVETATGEQGSLFLEPTRPRPIDKRAWTYQEGLLSPRILHFGSRLSIWDCAEETNASNNKTNFRFDTGVLADRRTIRSDYDTQSYVWWNIVGEYSSRSLTFIADKPIALAAVAEQFSRGFYNNQRVSEKYLAGHWTGDLSVSLSWQIETRPRRPKSAELHAPSWSWMSIDGVINNLANTSPSIVSSVQILEADTILTYPSLPYGPVQSGHITLVGNLESVAYEVTDPNDGTMNLINCNQYIGLTVYIDHAIDLGELPRPFGDQVWLLETDNLKQSDDYKFRSGLVLARVPVTTKYRRVGSWTVGSKQDAKRCQPSFDWIASWHSATITIV